ncbi:hypothetical protein [Prauserella cavernicola]|uniref:N-terminal of MaoC-like dehydratase domain-containing protein n=1 Tax=Prauserella cavernicola TaxID=2800127 RepID=A0A934QN51_9PSEU|nr:hypothetical protein [Prauserella cavernicola]MBK1783530.1 hypothetical protein [Prauserella cavernicola]
MSLRADDAVDQPLPDPWTSARLDPPVDAPGDLVAMVADFAPPPLHATCVLDAWRAQALAGVLGVEPPAEREGDALPLGWHEVYFRDPLARGDLAEDGHAAEHGLMPRERPRRRVFGGASLTSVRPLRLGDDVTRTSLLEDCRIKAGGTGWLLLLTELHDYAVAGHTALRERRRVVLRHDGPAPTTSPRTPRPAASEPAAPDAAQTLTFDPVTLFRFSALTYNPHRIHYDHRYATQVEGHANLLVHGPLSALSLLDLARRSSPTPLSRYDFSLSSPAYVDTALALAGSIADGRWSLTGTQDGRRVITATAS